MVKHVWQWIATHKGFMSFATIGTLASACLKAWTMYRAWYDGKVLALMTEATRNTKLEHPTMNIALLPFKISEVVNELKRTETNVYKSLRRLEAAGKVHEVKHGEWCLGNQTQREILNEQWSDRGRGGRFGGNRFNKS